MVATEKLALNVNMDKDIAGRMVATGATGAMFTSAPRKV